MPDVGTSHTARRRRRVTKCKHGASRAVSDLQEWRLENADLFKLDNWHGPLALATNWAVIGGTVYTATTQHLLPDAAFYLLIALPIIATRMRALATMLHEGAHGTLTASSQLGRILCTYPSAYLVFQTFAAYLQSHVRDHHGKHNVVGEDPDLNANTADGLYDETSVGRFVWRFVVSPFFGVRHVRMWKTLLKARLAAAKTTESMTKYQQRVAAETRKELPKLVACNLVFLAAWAIILGFTSLTLFWLVPLFYGFPIANGICELAEHFPYPITRAEDRLWHTRHRAFGPLSRHFVSIMNEGFHWIHHEMPKVPFWKVREAMDRLTEDFPHIRELREQQGSDRWKPFGLTRQFWAAIRESTTYASHREQS